VADEPSGSHRAVAGSEVLVVISMPPERLAIGVGVTAGSLTLMAFGFDSIIELASARPAHLASQRRTPSGTVVFRPRRTNSQLDLAP
jgi:hypothetical protein